MGYSWPNHMISGVNMIGTNMCTQWPGCCGVFGSAWLDPNTRMVGLGQKWWDCAYFQAEIFGGTNIWQSGTSPNTSQHIMSSLDLVVFLKTHLPLVARWPIAYFGSLVDVNKWKQVQTWVVDMPTHVCLCTLLVRSKLNHGWLFEVKKVGNDGKWVEDKCGKMGVMCGKVVWSRGFMPIQFLWKMVKKWMSYSCFCTLTSIYWLWEKKQKEQHQQTTWVGR